MTTALPIGQNYTGWVGIGTYANTVTDGWFWSIILLAICIVVFVMTYKSSGENVSAGFFAVSWAWFLFSILLNIMDFVPSSYISIGLGMLGFSIFALVLNKDRF
jgi:uncharacterized membrane protein YccC